MDCFGYEISLFVFQDKETSHKIEPDRYESKLELRLPRKQTVEGMSALTFCLRYANKLHQQQSAQDFEKSLNDFLCLLSEDKCLLEDIRYHTCFIEVVFFSSGSVSWQLNTATIKQLHDISVEICFTHYDHE